MRGNIFEHGGERQHALIKPFLDRARKYDPEENGDFEDFYFHLLESALHHRAEMEELEDWVIDVDDYRQKSEIVIATTLVESMSSFRDAAMESEEGPQQFANEFFEKLYKFGKERDWNRLSLHMQFMRSIGFHPQNPLSMITGKQMMKAQDYN